MLITLSFNLYRIVLNVFISSDNQSQNTPIIVCLFFEGKHTTGTKTEGKIRNYVLIPLVDVRGVEPRSYQIISYTLYFLCKCPDDQSEHSI